jgi:malate dehydrogenase (oxaloacetate-decarboxylating)(NADP+)
MGLLVNFSLSLLSSDIQGTGSVILGGFINAARLSAEASGRDLKDHRILFMGAGSAGVGVAKQLLSFFKNLGMSEEDAKERVWLVDTKVSPIIVVVNVFSVF